MAFAHTLTSVQQLKQQVIGRVLTPEDADYDKTRRAWSLLFNQYPAVIVVAENAEDVVAAVRYARDAGLGVGIQSTGHGQQQPSDGNLLIITSKMKGVQVNLEAHTARAEAGAMWKHVLEKATPHGLAPLLGSSPYVGIVGYTLGGGIGWLARRYGLAVDSVRSIDLVTADGELKHLSATENSDLFWGARGGGSNFGVVTALEFDLYPVATLYGGYMIYDGAIATEALRFFRDWVKDAPDELTSSIAVLKFPSIPQMPDAIRGKIQVIVRAAYAGATADGAALIQQWYDWQKPSITTFREMPFSEVGKISNDPEEPTAGYGSHEMFDELSDEAIDILVRHATNHESPLVFTEIRHAGGAIKRVPTDANAIGNRDANFYFQLGGPVFSGQTKDASAAQIKLVKADLQPYLHGGVYLNFMTGVEAQYRAKDAYQENYQRLLALKVKYDPDNMFRFGYQIVDAK